MKLLDRILPWRVRDETRKQTMQSVEIAEMMNRIRADRFMMETMRHFASATESRRRPNWHTLSMHADAEMLPDIPTMRSRSRLMVDTDAKASGLIRKEVTNIIGPSIGVQAYLPSQYVGMPESERKIITDRAENWFWEHVQSQRKDFDLRRVHSWHGLTRLRYRHFLVDGSLFIRYHIAPDGRNLPFVCEIIEPERIATPGKYAGNHRIREGLQFSGDGEWEGAWVMKHHPSDPYVASRMEFEFVPVMNALGLPNIIHHYDPHRYSASQGLPWLNTILPLLNDIADYKDAELHAKMLEAALAIFITLKRPEEFMEGLASSGGGLGSGLGLGTGNDAKRTKEIPVFKNMLTTLQEGEGIETVDPSRPGNNFMAFMDRQDRDIGLGIGRSFERVSNNYGAANFSATRVSGIEDDVEYATDFAMFAEAVLTPDWEWAMWHLSVEDGNPMFRKVRPSWQKYVKRSWDGLKDAKESTERISSITSDPITECQRLGLDFNDVARNQARAKKIIQDFMNEYRVSQNTDDGSGSADMEGDDGSDDKIACE